MYPDLLNGGQPSVPALNVITKQMPNTKAGQPVYFHCTAPNASFARQDGKKLPFVHGIFKAIFKEDIDYLTYEVEHENPYIRYANAQEVQAAETLEDPLGAVTKMVRPLLREELKGELSLEELQELIAKKKNSDMDMKSLVPPTSTDKNGTVIPVPGSPVNTPVVSAHTVPVAEGNKLDPAIVARAQAAILLAKKNKELLDQRQGGAAGGVTTASMNGADASSNSANKI